MTARRRARALAAVAGVAALGLLAWGLLTPAPDTTADVPSPAPAFALPLLRAVGVPGPLAGRLRRASAAGRLSLAELRGVPIVLNAWASWCPPCQQEAPVLQRAWRRAAPGGVLFVGLDVQDVREDALVFLRELGITYPNVADRGNATARRYRVAGLPTTFFLDARGRMVGRVLGAVSERQLEAGIAAAAAGRPLGAAAGGASRPLR